MSLVVDTFNVSEAKLTLTESKVKNLLMRGYSAKQMADALNIAEKTVKFHLTAIYKKIQVKGFKQLMVRELQFHTQYKNR